MRYFELNFDNISLFVFLTFRFLLRKGYKVTMNPMKYADSNEAITLENVPYLGKKMT